MIFDAKTNKFQGWIPKTLQDVNEFISKNPAEFNKPETWFKLVIIEKGSITIIGDVGIHFIDNHQCEIGCTLRKSSHGKGFATETLKALIDFLFNVLNKHRIVGSIDPENTGTIKLLKRLGFRKEAHFHKSLLVNGEWADEISYGILRIEGK